MEEKYLQFRNIFIYDENYPNEGFETFEKLILNFHSVILQSFTDYMLGRGHPD